jgi:hypothetical protein
MRIVLSSTLVILLSACGASVSPYARATAGRIGCPAPDIELGRIDREDRGPQSWVAYCGRTAYACSSSGEIENPRVRIVCSELGGPPTAEHGHRHRHRHR